MGFFIQAFKFWRSKCSKNCLIKRIFYVQLNQHLFSEDYLMYYFPYIPTNVEISVLNLFVILVDVNLNFLENVQINERFSKATTSCKNA